MKSKIYRVLTLVSFFSSLLLPTEQASAQRTKDGGGPSMAARPIASRPTASRPSSGGSIRNTDRSINGGSIKSPLRVP